MWEPDLPKGHRMLLKRGMLKIVDLDRAKNKVRRAALLAFQLSPPNGSQFDFAWLPARVPHVGQQHVG